MFGYGWVVDVTHTDGERRTLPIQTRAYAREIARKWRAMNDVQKAVVRKVI